MSNKPKYSMMKYGDHGSDAGYIIYETDKGYIAGEVMNIPGDSMSVETQIQSILKVLNESSQAKSDLIDNAFNSIEAVHDYFGYKEDWVCIPLEDAREFYWHLDQFENGSGYVSFAEKLEDLEDEDAGNFYQHPIYTQRFLPKYVYRTDEYTMISVDTQTDGNHFLQIFDNAKEVK